MHSEPKLRIFNTPAKKPTSKYKIITRQIGLEAIKYTPLAMNVLWDTIPPMGGVRLQGPHHLSART
jgi:hypothetical protein